VTAIEPEARYFSKVEFVDRWHERNGVSTRCLEWRGAKINNPHGAYGWFFLRKEAGITKGMLAHRWLYQRWVGSIPDGLHLDHLCRNTLCVNVGHLEPVTSKENTRRGLRGVLTTHCIRNHPYTPENTVIDAGARKCRICKLANQRASYQRRKAQRQNEGND
jgi:hypothetical protein